MLFPTHEMKLEDLSTQTETKEDQDMKGSQLRTVRSNCIFSIVKYQTSISGKSDSATRQQGRLSRMFQMDFTIYDSFMI